tara:strand:- start:518 stop:643 length:126 start_codon:yes stop_codon:yes gene_type:complete
VEITLDIGQELAPAKNVIRFLRRFFQLKAAAVNGGKMPMEK